MVKVCLQTATQRKRPDAPNESALMDVVGPDEAPANLPAGRNCHSFPNSDSKSS